MDVVPAPPRVRCALDDLAYVYDKTAALTPDQRRLLALYTEERQQSIGSLWRDGIEPLPFDDFSMALDGTPLTDRQHWVFSSTGCLRAAHLFTERRKVQEFVLVWGKGCLAGETPLTDEETRETLPVREWAERGWPLLIRSEMPGGHPCTVFTGPVYEKGVAQIFRVTLVDGRSFRATAAHQCLTPDGWLPVSKLIAGVTAIRCTSPVGAATFALVEAITPDGFEPYYDLTVPDTSCYYDANGILHHNSGKGWLSARFIAWVAYVVNSFALRIDPTRFIAPNLAPRSPLVAMNVAPDETLARTVFFKYLRANMQHPLLSQFAPVVNADDVRFFRPDPYGGKYEFLSLYSKHSRAAGLDGHNLIAFVGDEVDAFEVTSEGVEKAEEIHNILRSSASTRVGDRFIGFMISYPRTQKGFLLKLRDRALANITRHGASASFFTDTAATWDVRPDVSRENTASIQEDYDDDPRMAMAKYECIPLVTDEAWFETPERIDESVDPARVAVATWRPIITRKLNGSDGQVNEYISAEILSLRPVPGRAYYLGADGGVSGDAFTVSVWSIDDTPTAADWVCFDCAHEQPGKLQSAAYTTGNPLITPVPPGGTIPDPPKCGVCGSFAEGRQLRDYGTNALSIEWFVGQWHQRGATEAEAMAMLSFAGEPVAVPSVSCDLVITFVPRRPQRGGDIARTVDFEGVEEVIRQLIVGLSIRRARFDPYQLVGMVQRLQGVAGCHCDTLSFGNAEQYRRARLVKKLLYSGLLRLIRFRMPQLEEDVQSADAPGKPSDGWTGKTRQIDEWKSLQRRGGRIDHPPKGSKDIYDADAEAIWAAVTDRSAAVELLWAGLD